MYSENINFFTRTEEAGIKDPLFIAIPHVILSKDLKVMSSFK